MVATEYEAESNDCVCIISAWSTTVDGESTGEETSNTHSNSKLPSHDTPALMGAQPLLNTDGRTKESHHEQDVSLMVTAIALVLFGYLEAVP